MLVVIICPQFLIFLLLFLIMVECISLSNGFTIGNTVQFIIQFDVFTQMFVSYITLSSMDTYMGEYLMCVTFAHGVTILHHLFTKITGRVRLTHMIVNLT